MIKQFKCLSTLDVKQFYLTHSTPSLGQNGPVSDGNEGVLCTPQSSNIIGTSPSDNLVSYTGHLEKSYFSVEMQLVYFAAPADWARTELENIWYYHNFNFTNRK